MFFLLVQLLLIQLVTTNSRFQLLTPMLILLARQTKALIQKATTNLTRKVFQAVLT